MPRLRQVTGSPAEAVSSSRLCKQGTQLQHPRAGRSTGLVPRLPPATAHGAPLSPKLAHRRRRPRADKLHRNSKVVPCPYRYHNHRPRPRRAPGLPHLPPEPFAFPLPPRLRPGCHRPQPGPLPGREARAAACAGAPPSPHPPGQRGAPAGKESRAEPRSALPRSVPARPSAAFPAASARRCSGPRRHLVVFWGGAAGAPLPAAAPSSCTALTGTALRAHKITGSLSLGKTCEIIEFGL